MLFLRYIVIQNGRHPLSPTIQWLSMSIAKNVRTASISIPTLQTEKPLCTAICGVIRMLNYLTCGAGNRMNMRLPEISNRDQFSTSPRTPLARAS